MRAWLIGILAGGLLAYAVLEAQTPAASQGAVATASAADAARANGTPGNVTQSRVMAGASGGNNWLVNGGNFESQHFSPLKSINDQNINRLGLAWAIPIDSHMGLSTEPIVVDGVIYLGLPFDVVEAIDGVTGKIRWRFDPHIRINGPWRNSYEGRKNRGVAVWHGKVYVGTGDCRMVAIDAATGKKVWDTPVCDAAQTGITDAPRVGDGKVFTGWAGMEYDVRGGLVAVEAETGKKAWTFWTAPGDPSKPYESKTLEQIAKTWKGGSWELAGANVWTAMTYDPVTNLLFISTSTAGEAAGDFSNIKPSGNLLFANCIIAVNASTGQYVWHYQTAYPPDGAEDFHVLVANLAFGGKERRLIALTVPRNGVFYMLDARIGKEVNFPPRGVGGTAYSSLKQIDLSTLSSAGYQDAGRLHAFPPLALGTGGFPWGTTPRLGLCTSQRTKDQRRWSGRSRDPRLKPMDWGRGVKPRGSGVALRGAGFNMLSMLPSLTASSSRSTLSNQEPRWVVTLPVEINGGVLTTAGNLVSAMGTRAASSLLHAADTGRKGLVC